MISINPYVLIIQVVNFLICLALLNWLIIRPIRSVLALRREKNDALRAEADARNAEAALKLDSYEARLARARAAMAAERDEAKLTAYQAAQTRAEAAGGEARTIRKEATDRLQAESAEARRLLSDRVPDFARQALTRMLGA